MVLLNLCADWRRPCSVLDGGCGNGETSRWLARCGCDVIGVDTGLPYTSRCVRIDGVEPGTLSLVRGDLNSLNFEREFHVVALFGVLHYLGSPDGVEALLRRLNGWLVKDGLAVLTWITDDIPHLDAGVYLPSKSLVVGTMHAMGYRTLRSWDKVLEHAHGGNSHRHRIAYTAWTKENIRPALGR